MKRTLVLSTERLAELSSDELGAVNGGGISILDCIVIRNPSDFFISVCGCLTHYCGSIDVC